LDSKNKDDRSKKSAPDWTDFVNTKKSSNNSNFNRPQAMCALIEDNLDDKLEVLANTIGVTTNNFEKVAELSMMSLKFWFMKKCYWSRKTYGFELGISYQSYSAANTASN